MIEWYLWWLEWLASEHWPFEDRDPPRRKRRMPSFDRALEAWETAGVLYTMLRPVNVKDFGAKGDGVTDDTQAIQDAVNFVSKGSPDA